MEINPPRLSKPHNLEEAIDLVKKYEELANLRTIPLDPLGYNLSALTGFGSPSTCILCKPINTKCKLCIWGPQPTNCMNENYREIVRWGKDLNYIQGLLKTRIKLLKNRIQKWTTTP